AIRPTTTERRLRSAKRIAVLSALLMLIGGRVSAHRSDELLQAARIGIAPDRVEVELSLTPGIAVAEQFAGIDAARLKADVLRSIELSVDGRHLQLDRVPVTLADADNVRNGTGIIQVRATATVPPLIDGAHRLSFTNTYRREISVYLANALVP